MWMTAIEREWQNADKIQHTAGSMACEAECVNEQGLYLKHRCHIKAIGLR